MEFIDILNRFDRHPLIFRPTPLHSLPRFSEHLGGVELWVKREDCNGLAGGGNKARKLEYLVADALSKGCDTLVTVGGLQSNHTRLTAAAATTAGLKCVLVQRFWGMNETPEYQKVGNALLARVLGAEIRVVSGEGRILPNDPEFQTIIMEIKKRGGTPYVIPAGASDHPLGGLGFADGMQEALIQADAQEITFDAILIATSSGSTQAGLLAGLHLARRSIPVIGICVNDSPEVTRDVIYRIANATSQLVTGDTFLERDEIEVREEFIGDGYGKPGPRTIDAIEKLARLEGVLVDPVYEGKAIEGLIALSRQGRFRLGHRVLWWHLGGAQALHAYHGFFAIGDKHY